MLSMNNDTPQPLSLRKNILWNTVGCLFYQGCLWLTTIVVVWFSGYEDAGVLALAMAIGNIFIILATYYMRTYQVSDLANVYSQGNYCAFRFITLGLAFVVFIPYTVFTTTGTNAIIAVLMYLLFKTDEACADFLYGVDQCGGRMDYIGRSQVMRGIMALGCFSLGLWIAQSLIVATGLMFAGCLLITLVYDIPHACRFGDLRPYVHGRTALKLLREGLPAVSAVMVNVAVVSVSRQFLGGLMSEETLGIYASISTPAVLMQAVVIMLYTPLVGSMAEEWSSCDPGRIFRFLGKALMLIGVSLVACSAVLILVGPPLLLLVFGDSVAADLWIFPWSILVTALIALVSFGVQVLIVFRHAKAALVACGIALILAVILAPPAIQAYGINGINLSITVAYAIGIAIEMIVIVRAIKRR